MKHCVTCICVLLPSLMLALCIQAHAQGWGQAGTTAPTYQQADVAADAATVALSNFRSGADQVQNLDGKIRAAKAEASQAAAKKASLEAEKEQNLDDMRKGAFCRTCHRTKSQIEASGESWQHHLDENSGGQAVPATPEEIAAKSQEFDGRIADAAREQASADAQVTSAIQERTNAVQAVQQNMVLWRNAMQQEGQLLPKELSDQNTKLEQQVAEWQTTYGTLDQMEQRAQHPDSIGAPGQTPPAAADQQQIAQCKDGKQSLRDQMHVASNEMDRLKEQYQLKQSEWANSVLEGRKAWEQASAILGTLTAPLWTVPDLNIGANGWGMTVGSDKIGMKTPLGSASVTNNWLYGTQSVSVMMEKGVGPVSGGIGIQHTTTLGPNGVTTTDGPTGKANVFGQSVGTWMEGGPAAKQ